LEKHKSAAQAWFPFWALEYCGHGMQLLASLESLSLAPQVATALTHYLPEPSGSELAGHRAQFPVIRRISFEAQASGPQYEFPLWALV